jgi:ABC-type proline/glycine betaine transport system ATPase subunit
MCSRIMVMDAGQVGEYGSPRELLKNPKSLFSQLVAAEQLQEREGGFSRKETSQSSSDKDLDHSQQDATTADNSASDSEFKENSSDDAASLRNSSLSGLIESSDPATKKFAVNR